MPSSSKKQHDFMQAIAHSPSFAKKVGISQSVGKDFNEADKGRKFSKGGNTMASKMNPGFMAMMAKKKGAEKMAAFEKSGKDVEKKGMKEGSKADMAMDKKQMAMKKGGITAKYMAGLANDKPAGMKPVTKMASGGMPMVMKDGKKIPAFAADGEGKMKHGGVAKKMNADGMGYAKGGGIESKGKTKGTMVAMKKGGKC